MNTLPPSPVGNPLLAFPHEIGRFRTRFVGVLAATTVVVVAAGTGVIALREGFGHDHVHGLARIFDLDKEAGVPAWFSSACLLLCALTLALIAGLSARCGIAGTRHWGVLALIFVVLSLDETASFHELASHHLSERYGLQGLLRFMWVIPGLILTCAVGLWVIPFLRLLPNETRRRFLLAGFVYCSGALGMEMISGWWMSRVGGEDSIYWAMTVVEESLEMVGLVLFLDAMLRHVESQAESYGLLLVGAQPPLSGGVSPSDR